MGNHVFNIIDYLKDTLHLCPVENFAYRSLLDIYYLYERPIIPMDLDWLSKKIKIDKEVIVSVLDEFFYVTPDGYRNKRSSKDIVKSEPKNFEVASHSALQAIDHQINSKDIQKLEVITHHRESIKVDCPDDVQKDTWDSFLKARRLSKAVVTERVLKSIRSEAEKAGWSMEDALAEIVFRGWKSFKAEWVNTNNSLVGPKNFGKSNNDSVLNKLTRGLTGVLSGNKIS